MSSSNLYWTRNLVNGFGKMWFPLVLRELKDQHDNALLGSVVEELSSGFLFFGSSYPAPHSMSDPNLVLNVLAGMAGDLDLHEPRAFIEHKGRIPDQVVQFGEGVAASAGTGLFPAIPADIGLTIDYSSLTSATIGFGDDARVRQIPMDYLARLHRKLGGDASKIDPDVSIAIEDQYIVKSILIAKEYTIEFQSRSGLDSAFDAKLNKLNKQHEGLLKFNRRSNKQYAVEVKNRNPYMIGFSVVDWDDLG